MWFRVGLLAVVLAGCGSHRPSCRTADDCASGLVCEQYFCVPDPDAGDLDTDGGDAGQSDGDAGIDAGDITEDDAGIDAGDITVIGDPDGGDGADDAGYCTAHEQCAAPRKCRGHVCR